MPEQCFSGRRSALRSATLALVLSLFATGSSQGQPPGEPVAEWDVIEITDVGRDSARFHGIATPNGLPTVGSFLYIIEGAGSGQQEVQVPVGSGFQPVPFSREVTNLECETSYLVWVHADNSAGTDSGGSRQFKTSFCGAPPSVQTTAASHLTPSSATLNGAVNTGGLPTEVRFYWGLEGGSLMTETLIALLPGSSGSQTFSATLGGLACGTSYGFWAWAENEAGWDDGSFEFFETDPCGPPPFFASGFESGNLSGWTVVGPVGSTLVLFFDNFDDGVYDPLKWTYFGHTVRETEGHLQVNCEVTDQGGGANTVAIPVAPTGLITMTRRVRVFAANHYFDGGLRFQPGQDESDRFGISYADYERSVGNECPVLGFALFRYDANSHLCAPQGIDVSSWIPGIWGTWFREKLEWDPATGEAAYYMDDQLKLTMNVGPLPRDVRTLYLKMSTWGWYTGHYQHSDDLRVTQVAP